ncbi:MarR family winged helix-turn-helix transcriptional regulator [Oceanobacillus halotolerans]|uniref:MarR family winged helix-turn-helix transcriptional regulator n=1 Tax=Oceanobacillus halotolerans TaxID=2663380 RepID=UPI0013DC9A45|nr:MarR family transcriptional regulator [Oceanobacillus halotolerans]
MAEKREQENLSLKLFVVLTRALQSIKKQVEADIRSYGLNTTEFGVLELLFHKGDQPIQKIGDKVLLASSSITYVVDKLEEKKYLERRPCPTDRRITHAVLTDKGRELMEEIFPKHREAVHNIFEGLSTTEKETMITQLKKLGLYAEDL